MSALVACGLRAGYGGAEVLHSIDLHVDDGEVIVILGANGAGKTTTLLALAGVIPSSGSVEMLGRVAHGPLHKRAAAGLAFLPEDRGIVRGLTVENNLRLAGVTPADAYSLSPELRSLCRRKGAALSGGEQQMLALTSALVRAPKLLMGDELSFGLAPIIVSRMLGLIRAVADTGTAVVLVEQYAKQALAVADRAYVLRRGQVELEGRAQDLLGDIASIEGIYQGATTNINGARKARTNK